MERRLLKSAVRQRQSSVRLLKIIGFAVPVAEGDLRKRAAEIPHKDVLEPSMPVGVYAQEAYSTCWFAQDDRELLVRAGLDWGIVEELPRRIDSLRRAEAEWWKVRHSETPSERECVELRERAVSLRKSIIRDAEYAWHQDSHMLSLLRGIKKGSGDADLTMDLTHLQRFLSDHSQSLVECGVDPSKFEELDDCADRLPGIVAQYDCEKQASDSALTARNRAYTLVVVALEELRRCARYALWDNPKRLKGYSSDYFRRTHAKRGGLS
jgi:hypothetical protein